MSKVRLLGVYLDDDSQASQSFGFFLACTRLLGEGEADVAALIVGADPDEKHVSSARHTGVESILVVSHSQLVSPLQTEQWLPLLQPLVAEISMDIVILPAGGAGDELAARLAARMNGAALGLCSGLQRNGAGWTATKTLFGGRIRVALDVAQGPCFAVVHSQNTQDVADQPFADVVPKRLQLSSALPAMDHIDWKPSSARRKPLEGADIVVSGGRGVDAQGFSLLQQLADKLGAALGGSLPSVDAGWVPVSHQVGQSGKYVTSELYLAVAISGTPQHLAGIAPHTSVIAINKDDKAEIFRRATVGLITDWRVLLPALIKHI